MRCCWCLRSREERAEVRLRPKTIEESKGRPERATPFSWDKVLHIGDCNWNPERRLEIGLRKQLDGGVVAEAGRGGDFANFLDGGCDDWRAVVGVGKLEPHAPTDEAALQHAAAPCGTGNGDGNWLGAEFRMAGDERGTVFEKDRGVAMMLSLDLQHGSRRQVVQENAAFNLRLNDLVIDLIAEIGVGHEKGTVGHGKVWLLGTV